MATDLNQNTSGNVTPATEYAASKRNKGLSIDLDETLDKATKDKIRDNTIADGIGYSFRELYAPNKTDFDDTVKLHNNHPNAFNRYKTVFPEDEISSFKTYVFIVRPDLNMLQAIKEDAFFADIMNTSPTIMRNLTYSQATELGDVPNTHFISFLYDRTLSYNLPDFNVKTYALDQPFTGCRTTYAGNSNESRSGTDFTITFRENSNLDVFRFFDAWVRYIDNVSTGIFSPFVEYMHSKFLNGVNEIDYATSVYLMMTKADGTELVYWHKQTGAIPTGVPHTNWSFNSGGDVDNNISIDFSGGYPDAMHPRILVDFNYNAGLLGEVNEVPSGFTRSTITHAPHARMGKYKNGRDFQSGNVIYDGGTTLVGGPYVAYDPNRRVYKLKWRQFE